jgi:hypothetical protein
MIKNPSIGELVSYEDTANLYCEGIIRDCTANPPQWLITFEDGHEEWSDLQQHGWRLLGTPEEAASNELHGHIEPLSQRSRLSWRG